MLSVVLAVLTVDNGEMHLLGVSPIRLARSENFDGCIDDRLEPRKIVQRACDDSLTRVNHAVVDRVSSRGEECRG
jgi:hypothetical protein